jgi:methionine-rich copper-binding protein CopC
VATRPIPSGHVQRLVVGLTIVLLGVLAVPSTGAAHTGFDYSLPTQDASVAEPVSEITVAFTQPVTLVGNGFEVLNPQGEIVLPTPITDDDRVFRLILDPAVAGGEVGVRYEVTSLDGHVVDGGFSFVVDAPLPTTTVPTTIAAPVAPITTTPATAAPPVSTPTTIAPTTSVDSTTSDATTTPTTTSPTTTSPLDGNAEDADDSRTATYIAIAAAIAVAAAGFVVLRGRNAS